MDYGIRGVVLIMLREGQARLKKIIIIIIIIYLFKNKFGELLSGREKLFLLQCLQKSGERCHLTVDFEI